MTETIEKPKITSIAIKKTDVSSQLAIGCKRPHWETSDGTHMVVKIPPGQAATLLLEGSVLHKVTKEPIPIEEVIGALYQDNHSVPVLSGGVPYRKPIYGVTWQIIYRDDLKPMFEKYGIPVPTKSEDLDMAALLAPLPANIRHGLGISEKELRKTPDQTGVPEGIRMVQEAKAAAAAEALVIKAENEEMKARLAKLESLLQASEKVETKVEAAPEAKKQGRPKKEVAV